MSRIAPRYFLFVILSFGAPVLQAQTWQSQAISQTVPGLWGISMFDTERGIAGGGASVPNSISGVVRRMTGNATWQVVAPANFTPALAAGFSFWSGVCSIRGTGVAFVCGSSSQIYKSVDYGATWQQKTGGISGSKSFFDIFFKNQNEGLVVGADGTAYYTGDGGTTWTPQSTGVTNDLYAVHCAGTNWYVSGASNTILRFVAPSTWTNLSANLTAGTFPLIEGLQFLDDQVGTISGYNSAGSTHVLRTTDGGSSWAPFSSQPPLGSQTFFSSVYFFSPNVGWVANAFDPVGFTSNGGNSWTAYSPTGSGTGAISRLDFLDQQNGWASGGALGGGPLPTGYILRYTGPAPVPDISASDASVDFGTLTPCDYEKQLTVVLRNTGTAPLTIPLGGVNFTNPSDFTVIKPLFPLTVAPGDSLVVTVRWNPPMLFYGAIPAGTTMNVKSNDAAHGIWKIALNGFRYFGDLSLTMASLVFPTLCGISYSDTTVDVTPIGNVPPILLAFDYYSGDSTVQLLSPPLGTAVTGPMTLRFRLIPKRLGALAGVYRLRIGDPGCPRDMHINFMANHRKNALTASPALLDFGEICVGTSKELPITLNNIGNTPATVLSRVHVSGPDVFPNVYPGSFGPVPVGAGSQYLARFAPNDTGVYVATYQLILGPCPDTVTITLRGRGVMMLVGTIPSGQLLMGPTTAGQTLRQNVVFTNIGSVAITVGGVRLAPSHPDLTIWQTPPLPIIIQPNGSMQVTVQFTPAGIETVTAELCLLTTVPCSDSLCINVTARSDAPPAIVIAGALPFGLQSCSPGLRDTLHARNLGPGPLNITAMDITGPQAAHFRVVEPTPPVLVSAGDSLPIVVEYRSPVEGTSSATLTLTHNDPAVNGTTAIALTGRRTVTEFVVEGDTATTMTVCIKNPSTRSFVLRNPSPRPLQITALGLLQGAPAFQVASDSLPVTIPPQGSAAFTLTFFPRSSGSATAVVRIASEPCAFTYLVTVAGMARSSQLTVAPQPVDFGTVTIGASDTRAVQIINTGTEPITVEDIIVRPSHPALALSALPSFPLTLLPGTPAAFTVRYAPTAAGTVLTSVCAVTSTPCRDTICGAVIGVSQTDGIAFNRSALDIVLDPCAQAMRCDTARIVNNSPRDVTVTDVFMAPAAGFTLAPPPALPFTLSKGQWRDIVVCASADFTGLRSSKLTVQSNDPNYPVIELAVTARRDSSAITAERRVVDFGAIACSFPRAIDVAIASTGSIDERCTLAHAPAAPFGVATAFPLDIGAGSSATLSLRFAPAAAGAYTDSVVLTSARCGRSITIILTGSLPADPFEVSPSPLLFPTVASGGSATRSLTVANTLFARKRVASVTVVPTGEFTYTGSLPVTVDSGSTATLPVRFAPSAPGTKSASVIIVFDEPCQDTVAIRVEGDCSDGALSFAPAALDFGTRAQCEQPVLEDTLVNGGGTPITLTGSSITGSGFRIINPVTANETLPAGGRRSFSVQLQPAALPDGAVAATLIVTTTDAGQPSVALPLAATKQTLQPPDVIPVAFGSIPVGVPSQRIVMLGNLGSAPLAYTTASFPPGVAVAPAPPFTVDPAQSLSLTVTFTPSTPGTQSLNAPLVIMQPCADSTVLHITAEVLGGIAQRDLLFGFIPNCRPAEGTAMLINTQPAAVELRSLHIGGQDSAAFSVIAPSSLPLTINAGDTLPVLIRCMPDSNSRQLYAATLAATVRQGGSDMQYALAIMAQIYEPLPQLTRAVDFGPVTVTLPSAPRTVVFRNIYPDTLRVTSVRSASSAFRILSVEPALPAVLAPLDSLRVEVVFTPEQAGPASGELELAGDLPCGGFTSVTACTGTGVDDLVRAALSIPDIVGQVDETVMIPVALNTDVGAAQVASWSGDISFDASMLYPLGLETANTLSQGMDTVEGSHAGGTYHIEARGGTVAAGQGTLVALRCLVLVGGSQSTALALSQTFDFSSGRARVTSRRNGSFTLTGYCDAGGKRFVQERNGLLLFPNVPNPFYPTTTITYRLPRDGTVELSVYDLMGRPVAILEQAARGAGTHRVVFTARELPPGLYRAVLRFDGDIVTQPMMLSR